jgi:hypothetical protein
LESRLERWSGQRDCLRVAVWTGDLGFVKVGACVGLCISVAVSTAWSLILVFTLAEEDVVVSFGDGRKRWPICAKAEGESGSYAFDRIWQACEMRSGNGPRRKGETNLIKYVAEGNADDVRRNGAQRLPLSVGWDEVYWRRWVGLVRQNN